MAASYLLEKENIEYGYKRNFKNSKRKNNSVEKIKIKKDSIINATYSGKTIFLTNGLYDYVKNKKPYYDKLLLRILGHELIHLQNNDNKTNKFLTYNFFNKASRKIVLILLEHRADIEGGVLFKISDNDFDKTMDLANYIRPKEKDKNEKYHFKP